MTTSSRDVPTFDELMNPTLEALHQLGGSASIQELADEIVELMNLPPEVAELPHDESGSQTEVEYRAAWARTYLKKFGLVNNSKRGVWSLTVDGRSTTRVDPQEVVAYVRALKAERPADEPPSDEEDATWSEQLLAILLEMDPTAFERLCQRLLRESGFIEVEVTRRSGDGGIDGYGVIRIVDLISFTVLFQSKRHRGNIGPNTVRDFRGAMVGRADKGLLITTGGFTREARREATRDGAPPIDLIDGEQLVEKLRELRLGVTVTEKVVEEVAVDEAFFDSL